LDHFDGVIDCGEQGCGFRLEVPAGVLNVIDGAVAPEQRHGDVLQLFGGTEKSVPGAIQLIYGSAAVRDQRINLARIGAASHERCGPVDVVLEVVEVSAGVWVRAAAEPRITPLTPAPERMSALPGHFLGTATLHLMARHTFPLVA
jgi:hypothetical protein